MMSPLPFTVWPSDFNEDRMTVTKQEIAYALSDVTGLSVKTGKVPVDTLFGTIRARYVNLRRSFAG
jgi:hypothetical protein